MNTLSTPEGCPVALRFGAALVLVSLLGGCADAPRWGAWSQRPTSAEIATVLQATPYEPYHYPAQPNPALVGRPAAPGSGRAAAAAAASGRTPSRVDITVDEPNPASPGAEAPEPDRSETEQPE